MRRRVPTVLVTILVALLAIPAMLIAAAFVTFNTPQGRYVLEVVTEWASGGIVRLDGLAGRFPDHLRLRRLALRDARGAWLVGDDLTADWSPLELFHGRLHVERLTAERVEMRRAPSYSTRRTHPRRQQQPSSELPFTIQLDHGTLPQVDLAAALAGTATALRLDGGGSYRSLEQTSVEFKAQRLDQAPSAYALSLQSNDQHVQGRLDLQEDANGPLTNLIGLPGLGALYDLYSFNVIPALGRAVVGDAESYRYLVESIRRFLTPQAFAQMMRAAGFARVSHRLMSGGIVALHSGWRL